MRFAISVQAAYRQGNFRRFFHLATRGPYLAGCLMHIFFPTMRQYALKVFNISGMRAHVPLEDIAPILLMEGEEEDLLKMCEHHGLTVQANADGNLVLVQRASTFITPVDHLPKRLNAMISAKASSSRLEDVICAPESHEWGGFISTAPRRVLRRFAAKPSPVSPMSLPVSPVQPAGERTSGQGSPVEGLTVRPAHTLPETPSPARPNGTFWNAPAAVAEVVKPEPAPAGPSREQLEAEERERARAAATAEKEAQESALAARKALAVEQARVAQAAEEARAKEAEARERKRQQEEEERRNEVARREAQARAEEQARLKRLAEEEAHLAHLAELRRKAERRSQKQCRAVLHLHFSRWRRETREALERAEEVRRREARNAAALQHCAPCPGLPVSEVPMGARVTASPRMAAGERELRARWLQKVGAREAAMFAAPLDVPALVSRALRLRSPHCGESLLCWKLVVSSEVGGHPLHPARRWLRTKLSRGGVPRPGLLSLYVADAAPPPPEDEEQELPTWDAGGAGWTPRMWFCACEAESGGSPGMQAAAGGGCLEDAMRGGQALVFLSVPEEAEATARARFAALVGAIPAGAQLPVLVLVAAGPALEGDPVETTAARLGLHTVDRSRVGDARVVVAWGRAGGRWGDGELREGLMWLAANSPGAPQLREAGLGTLVLEKLAPRLLHLERAVRGAVGPQLCVDAFNAAAEETARQLQAVVEHTPRGLWPPPELDERSAADAGAPALGWDNPAHFVELCKQLQAAKLPDILEVPGAEQSHHAAVDALLPYMARVAGQTGACVPPPMRHVAEKLVAEGLVAARRPGGVAALATAAGEDACICWVTAMRPLFWSQAKLLERHVACLPMSLPSQVFLGGARDSARLAPQATRYNAAQATGPGAASPCLAAAQWAASVTASASKAAPGQGASATSWVPSGLPRTNLAHLFDNLERSSGWQSPGPLAPAVDAGAGNAEEPDAVLLDGAPLDTAMEHTATMEFDAWLSAAAMDTSQTHIGGTARQALAACRECAGQRWSLEAGVDGSSAAVERFWEAAENEANLANQLHGALAALAEDM
ncbi:hypothetical protein CYMTET_29211 [Cymbomonas tetramitiformis]|uniref:SAC3/GANP/THP3 conserved domain-containing protein n=1 Tax=Cymbomonas tetramitiformis TaxID=36881 RepID=A0AAE0FL86_9CHLO|nr:hypothetical protein CYMTET_29211 [Cymbomonas tetramitiformis]